MVQGQPLDRTLLVRADVPDDVAWTDLDPPPLGWRALGSPEAVAAGLDWFERGDTALLRVPSALVPEGPNWVVNTRHPDAGRIGQAPPAPLEWEPRLFGIPAPSPQAPGK